MKGPNSAKTEAKPAKRKEDASIRGRGNRVHFVGGEGMCYYRNAGRDGVNVEWPTTEWFVGLD